MFPLHRDFLGFLVCSQSGDHPWKPFFFFFWQLCDVAQVAIIHRKFK
jgi:hypothetical protein